MKLVAEQRAPQQLMDSEQTEMYRLLQRYFENTQLRNFIKDLEQKDTVILLRCADSGAIVGFSTQKLFEHHCMGQDYRIVFSGDTIVACQAWGQLLLPLLWGQWMYSLWQREPTKPLIWMLISKGPRTYRFLPTLFRSYYPSPLQAWSRPLLSLRNSLGAAMFPGCYQATSGVISGAGWNYYLRQEPQQLPIPSNASANVLFFLGANPGFHVGDELLCLTHFRPSNLKPFYRRALERRVTNAAEHRTQSCSR